MKIKYFWLLLVLVTSLASATVFPLPADGGSVIGSVKSTVVKKGETFFDIARKNDLGYYQLVEANPSVNPDDPKPGTIIILPERYVLPNAPRDGIVVNLSELRLYYYPKGKHEVMTFPVGVAKQGWLTTPLGKLTVIEHKKNPAWYVPKSIRENRLKVDGVELPQVVPPGPDNPLGDYMMRLSRPTYLIHGTNNPSGIGRRSTSGCISLYPEDIEKLFGLVKNGTPVHIVNEPYKLGFENGDLYLESHVPLAHMAATAEKQSIEQLMDTIEKYASEKDATVFWQRVTAIGEEEQGLPQVIGKAQPVKS